MNSIDECTHYLEVPHFISVCVLHWSGGLPISLAGFLWEANSEIHTEVSYRLPAPTLQESAIILAPADLLCYIYSKDISGAKN